jgi:cell wall-associated NlpC family hydrolase
MVRRTAETMARLDALRDALDTLAAAQAELPLAMFDVVVGAEEGEPALRGTVLTFRQRDAVARLAREHGARVEVAVIADPATGLEVGWADISPASREALEVWRDPGRAGDGAARQTEYLPGDGPLRVLSGPLAVATTGDAPAALVGNPEAVPPRGSDLALVQGPDLALGWAPTERLRAADASAARAAWAALPRAEPDAAVLPDPRLLPALGAGGPGAPTTASAFTDALLAAARAGVGAPYRWGGTTPDGYDCSGLVQRAFLAATGVLLPRHTAEQRRVGARITVAEVRAGDLLFASVRGRRVGHVMLMSGPDRVIHACRTEERVIEEDLAENALRYAHQGWRRPVLLS